MHTILSFIKKRPIFLVSLLVLVIGLAYYFWPQSTPQVPPESIVEVETIAKGDMAKSVKMLAHVTSRQETTFISHMKGRMKTIFVEEGKPAKKGTLLAELDNDEIAREYAHAKTKVTLAQDQFNRLKQLQKSNAQSQASLDKAHEGLLRAQIELEHAQDKLNKSQFVAPFDGVCGVFKFRPGQSVADGDVVVSFYDPSGYVLNIDVPQTLLQDVQAGELIRYKDGESKIVSVQKSLDPKSHMGIARAEVPASWKVSSGQLISLEVDVENKHGVLTLPRNAVFLKDGNSFVYTIVEGKANLQPIQVGLQGKHRVEITEGLKEGDKVILKGQENTWPTKPVKEFKPEDKPAEKPKE